MSLARRYLFLCSCVLLLFGYMSLPFLGCSNSSISNESFSLDASDVLAPSDLAASSPEAPPQDAPPCPNLPRIPYHKQSGSWVLGPQTIAYYKRPSYPLAIATDPQNNVILLAYISDLHYILMKIGTDSTLLWEYTFSWLHTSEKILGLTPTSIQVDTQGNIYLLGRVTKQVTFGSTTLFVPEGEVHVVLLKFSPQGIPLWIYRFQEFSSFTSFVLSPQGDIYVAGFIYYRDYPFANNPFGNISFPKIEGKQARLVVAKYGKQGQLLWSRPIYCSDPYVEGITSFHMTMDLKENLYITSEFVGTLQFGTARTLSLHPPESTSADGIFVTKLDKQGSFLWATPSWISKNTQYEGLRSNPSVVVDKEGNTYLTGSLTSSRDFGSLSLAPVSHTTIFVAKLTPTGNFAWAVPAPKIEFTQHPERTYPLAHKLHHASDGSLILTGTHADASRRLVFAAKFDEKGKWLYTTTRGEWDRVYQDSSVEQTALDNQGNLFVTGYFLFSTTFGTVRLRSVWCPPSLNWGSDITPSLFLWRLEKP